MFLSLLLVTFVVALAVSTTMALIFKSAIRRILSRIIADPIHAAWERYLLFAIYVVGISSGVRLWELERYITPRQATGAEQLPLVLNLDRWVLEVYRTVIGTLQGVAWLLLVFFVVALIGFVIIRLGELRHGGARKTPAESREASASGR